MFAGKKILIGVTGGIAAYKVCFLVRSLKKQDGDVRVILTQSAERFVTRTTLEALSGNPVQTDTFGQTPDASILHIELANWPDCFLIAPATANMLGKAAHGIADDLLSTTVISAPGPVLFVPAMNDRMWLNPATLENVRILKEREHQFIEPGSGELACDTTGVGRMAEPEEIERRIAVFLELKRDLAGRNVLVTAGGTEEPIDPVRVISNRSSGKMGIAVATTAAARGADVTLILGTHTAAVPDSMRIINVKTAAEMNAAVRREIVRADALVMAAAVADYRPKSAAASKIKKSDTDSLSIELERTDDILLGLTEISHGAILAGFSLETENGIDRARDKMSRKKLDLIVLNNPLETGAGFDLDTNKITILEPKAEPEYLPVLPKIEAAHRILDRIARMLQSRT